MQVAGDARLVGPTSGPSAGGRRTYRGQDFRCLSPDSARTFTSPSESLSGVVPGVASPTPVSRSSGSSWHQGESGTAWGEGHARARGAWGEPQVWSPSHELCAHLPAEPGGPPHGTPARFSGRGAGGASHITARRISPHPLDGVVCGPPRRPTRLTSRKAGGSVLLDDNTKNRSLHKRC